MVDGYLRGEGVIVSRALALEWKLEIQLKTKISRAEDFTKMLVLGINF